MWGMFYWRTLDLLIPISHGLNTTAYLTTIAEHVHPFMATIYHLLMAASSKIMHHVTKQKSQTDFINMKMSLVYFSGLSSQHLWDVVEWEIHSMNMQMTDLQKRCDAIKSHGPESQRNVSKILWNPCHEEPRLF